MSGTTVTPIWEKDGQYIVQTVGTAAITLGQCVAIDVATADTVLIGTAALKAVPLGVALKARRFSRTQTDNSVAVGEKVTVVTRGVVNVEASGTVTRGQLVELANAGEVATHTPGSATYDEVFGLALTTATNTAVKVLLMRG